MERLYVSEMNREQLEKVFNANEKVRQKISDWVYENDMDYAHDILSCFDKSCIDYCIGYDRGTFIKCLDANKFMDGVKKMQDDYCFLDGHTEDAVSDAVELMRIISELENFLSYSTNMYSAYECCYAELEDIANDIADNMHDTFTNMFYDAIVDDKYHLEMFLDCYNDYFSDCYIDADADDYVLYRNTVEKFN